MLGLLLVLLFVLFRPQAFLLALSVGRRVINFPRRDPDFRLCVALTDTKRLVFLSAPSVAMTSGPLFQTTPHRLQAMWRGLKHWPGLARGSLLSCGWTEAMAKGDVRVVNWFEAVAGLHRSCAVPSLLPMMCRASWTDACRVVVGRTLW